MTHKKQARKEIEEIRQWIQDKDVNQLSFETQQNMPRLRSFKNNEVSDPAYSFIRSLQLHKEKEHE